METRLNLEPHEAEVVKNILADLSQSTPVKTDDDQPAVKPDEQHANQNHDAKPEQRQQVELPPSRNDSRSEHHRRPFSYKSAWFSFLNHISFDLGWFSFIIITLMVMSVLLSCASAVAMIVVLK